MCVGDVVPPTVFLPPLKLLKACSDKEISRAIASLRYIYLPEVRGSSRRRHEQHSRAVDADTTHILRSHLTLEFRNVKKNSESSDLSAIRADAFERTFAIQWLTRFVSLFSEVVTDPPGSLAVSSQALEEAASLLAVCAGSAASGTVTRTFTFPLSSGVSVGSQDVISTGREVKNGVSVVLRDAPLESGDFSSVGAQTWGGSCILAELIAENPRNFSIFSREDVELNSQRLHFTAPIRALELGAGTGLASLVLGKVLGSIRGVRYQCQGQSPRKSYQAAQNIDTVIATDFHPSVLANLGLNFAVNFPPQLFDSQTYVGHDGILRSSETVDMVPNMVVLPLDWSVIHSLGHPVSSPRIGSSSTETEDKATNQISTPGEDTTNVGHCNPFEADTAFHSQAQTQGLDHTTEIICGGQLFPDDNANAQTTASPCRVASQLDVPFNLIIGADIIYEQSHARWVRSCVERFLRKPTRCFSQADHLPARASAAAAPGYNNPISLVPLLTDRDPGTPLFHLVVPLRRTHAVECRSVEEVFPQAADILLSRRRISQTVSIPHQLSDTFGRTGHISVECHDRGDPMVSSAERCIPLELAIVSQEDIWCDAYSDREEGEVVYRYYRIGWV